MLNFDYRKVKVIRFRLGGSVKLCIKPTVKHDKKEFKKAQREAKRLLADEQKSLFAFYASLEETYESICPDMYLIENTHFNTEDVKEFQSQLDQ